MRACFLWNGSNIAHCISGWAFGFFWMWHDLSFNANTNILMEGDFTLWVQGMWTKGKRWPSGPGRWGISSVRWRSESWPWSFPEVSQPVLMHSVQIETTPCTVHWWAHENKQVLPGMLLNFVWSLWTSPQDQFVFCWIPSRSNFRARSNFSERRYYQLN